MCAVFQGRRNMRDHVWSCLLEGKGNDYKKNKTSFVFQQGVVSKRLTRPFGNEISLGSTKDEKYQKTSFKISLRKVFPLVFWTSDWIFELCKYHLRQFLDSLFYMNISKNKLIVKFSQLDRYSFLVNIRVSN